MFTSTNFINLLKQTKYNILLTNYNNLIHITGNKVKGYLNLEYNKLYFDCKSLFDKETNCPIRLPLPNSIEQAYFVLDKLKWLATKEANSISRYFDYNNFITKYPPNRYLKRKYRMANNIEEAFTEGFNSYPDDNCPYSSGAKKEAWWKGFKFAKKEKKNISKMS